MKNNSVPTLAQLKRFNVNREGQVEGIRQTFYDFQTYAAAGQTSLIFFQVPQGQSSKTIAYTNMESAGQLPVPKQFLVQSIEIYFFPGVDPGTKVTTVAETEFTNDVYTVMKSGSLDFFIGSKSYLQEAPIGRFPSTTGLRVEAAHAIVELQASAADAELQVSTDYAVFSGKPYFLAPPIFIPSNQNFNVTLRWPSVVALPSTTAARIGIVMNGILYRLSQ